MWIYVFLGNVLRGIGETPVQPLGISYIDDYAQSENAALYIGNTPDLPSILVSHFILDPIYYNILLIIYFLLCI